MLQKNQSNRLVNSQVVNSYVDQMLRDQWELNGESIKFSKSGRLIDGQHRLTAIIKSNCEIRSFVTYDLDESSFLTIDTGKARNAADVFKVVDIKNGTNITTGLMLYLTIKRGNYLGMTGQKKSKITNKDILDEYNSNPDYYQNLHLKSDLFYRDSYRIVRKSEYFAFTELYEQFHGDKIYEFWDYFLKKEAVPGLLYNKLMSEAISKRKLPKAERRALFIKAINYFLQGKELKILRLNADEEMPSIWDGK